MERIIYVLTALLLAAGVLLTGCGKGNVEPARGSDAEYDGDGFLMSIATEGQDGRNRLGSGDGGTKTALNSDDYICWCPGDAVWVNGSDADHSLYIQPMDATSPDAVVNGSVAPNASGVKYIGHYPANTFYWDNTSWEAKLPGSRTYNAYNPLDCIPLYSESDTKHMTFRSPFAIMELKFTGNKRIKTIDLSCDSGNLSGNFRINATGTAEISSSGSTSVSIDLGSGFVAGKGTKIYIALAPGTYTNLALKVTTDETDTWAGLYYKKVSSFTAVKGKIYGNEFNTNIWEGVLMWWPEADKKGLYWATKNLGATCGSTAQSWYGDWFPWAACVPIYSAVTYTSAHAATLTMKTSKPETSPATKYANYASASGPVWTNTPYRTTTDPYWSKYTNFLDELEMSDDAARYNWGGGWRLPTGGTNSEQATLFTKCGGSGATSNVKTNKFPLKMNYKGVTDLNGMLITSSETGKQLFMPLAGHWCSSTTKNQDLWSASGKIAAIRLWSRTVKNDNKSAAHLIYIPYYVTTLTDGMTPTGGNFAHGDDRQRNMSIRPVQDL